MGRSVWRSLAVAGALLDAGAVALYLVAIDAQGDEAVTDPSIVGWALAMAVPAVLSASAAAVPSRVAPWLLAAAAVPAGAIGVLAIFSVGLLFLGVAGLCLTAAVICLAHRGASPGARRAVDLDVS